MHIMYILYGTITQNKTQIKKLHKKYFEIIHGAQHLLVGMLISFGWVALFTFLTTIFTQFYSTMLTKKADYFAGRLKDQLYVCPSER